MKRFLLTAVSIFIFIGCGGGGSGSYNRAASNNIRFLETKKDIVINRENQVERVEHSLNSEINLHIEGKKDIYVVVTSHFPNQSINISSSINTANIQEQERVTKIIENESVKSAKYREITSLLHQNLTDSTKYEREINRLERDINSVSLNQTESFCIDMDSNHNCTHTINAQVKKIVKNIETSRGVKSLVIWLESGDRTISQTDIDKLANIFLRAGGGNDIYDWVTNVYGSEWGDDAQSVDKNLIANSNIIDILLYNMNNNYLAGYFWGKDNFKKSALNASNEKIMFYLNTSLLKNNPTETYTTIGHEFQHMIHFYQRNVLKDLEDSTWFDELMAESTEDLIATKINYKGPRNVDPNNGTAGKPGNTGGRYPIFNRYNIASLINWQNSVKDYSKVSAFGAYLLRNYNGATMLNKLMYSDNTDQYAVLDATGEADFYKLIANWGIAVILSDKVNLNNNLQYNFGDFKYTNFTGIDYALGSINFFNYLPTPQFKKSAILGDSANLYYKVGSGLSGNIKLNIQIEKGADIAIIAK